jgi:serine/threonine protein kinase
MQLHQMTCVDIDGEARCMAPEMYLVKKSTRQTDVWSFGLTLAQVFNEGKLPFYGLSCHPL